MDEAEDLWWVKEGYLAGRPLEDDLWLIIASMAYTYRVLVCRPAPYGGCYDHYCYTNLADAVLCFDTWDGHGSNPVEGWTRYHEAPSRA